MANEKSGFNHYVDIFASGGNGRVLLCLCQVDKNNFDKRVAMSQSFNERVRNLQS